MSRNPRKWYFLQPDGSADEPQAELDGQTPLQAAVTPAIDELCRTAMGICLKTIPDGYDPGSDIGNLSLLGYDPRSYFTGRSPIEVAAMGVELKSSQVAFRCNLVNIQGDGPDAEMVDFSAGHISTEEATQLMQAIAESLPDIQVLPGVSYRHAVVAEVDVSDLKTTPPHDIQGQAIAEYLPKGAASSICAGWSEKARSVLSRHTVNQARIARGDLPATDIWLWGQGGATALVPFSERYPGWQGSMITAVDLLRGLAVLSGMENIQVEGATGFIDTNYDGKAQAAIDSDANLVFVHLEAPDESSHMGRLDYKIESLQSFDEKIVRPVLEKARQENAGIIMSPDHPTYLRTRTHALADVPCLVWVPDADLGGIAGYDERLLQQSEELNGWELLDYVRNRFCQD